MSSLMQEFLAHNGPVTAYPCGIKVKESKKMLSELPELKDVLCAPSNSKLLSRLAKGTTSAKPRSAERG